MSKVQQMNTQQIQSILLAAQAQQIDLNSAEAIKAFTEGLTAKPAVVTEAPKETKPRVLKPGQIACMARVWSKTGQKPGTGLDSCGKASVEGCDLCSVHKKQFDTCPEPCVRNESGWVGLYMGRIDKPIPYKNPEGEIAIVWNNNPEVMAQINADKANGAVHCKFTTEAGYKKAPSVTRVRKTKTEVAPVAASEAGAPVAVKGKKGKKTSKKSAKPSNIKGATNAFMYFSNEKRAEVKAKLLADFLAENPEADKKAITAATAVGAIAKAIGQMYKELSDEAKETYKALEVADKLRYNAEMEAYKAQEALGAVVSEEAEAQEDSQEETEEETPAQEESSIEATEINIDGVDYLYDSNTGTIYDLDCNELGKLVDGKIVN